MVAMRKIVSKRGVAAGDRLLNGMALKQLAAYGNK
jgi:hypothetical protein